MFGLKGKEILWNDNTGQYVGLNFGSSDDIEPEVTQKLLKNLNIGSDYYVNNDKVNMLLMSAHIDNSSVPESCCMESGDYNIIAIYPKHSGEYIEDLYDLLNNSNSISERSIIKLLKEPALSRTYNDKVEAHKELFATWNDCICIMFFKGSDIGRAIYNDINESYNNHSLSMTYVPKDNTSFRNEGLCLILNDIFYPTDSICSTLPTSVANLYKYQPDKFLYDTVYDLCCNFTNDVSDKYINDLYDLQKILYDRLTNYIDNNISYDIALSNAYDYLSNFIEERIVSNE
jgi:hypothetical protein